MDKGYIKTRPKTVVDVTKIVTIHDFEFGSDFVFCGESHNFWELVYVNQGNVLITRDTEELVLAQGQVIFHKPNEFHSIRAMDSSPNFLVISFASTSLAMVGLEGYCGPLERPHRALLASIVKEAERCYIIPKNDTKLRQLRRRPTAPIGSEQLIKNYLELFLITLMRSLTETEQGNPVFVEKSELQSRLVPNILRMMEENPTGALRVEDIARQTNYSRAYVFREFKRATGKSLMAYYNERRIQRAAELLGVGALSVREIAETLGFDTPNYFSKSFKRIMGTTPTAYKKRSSAQRPKKMPKKMENGY